MICPPAARIGPVTPEERRTVIGKSPVKGKYDTAIDPESAFEMLQKRPHERDRRQATAGERDKGRRRMPRSSRARSKAQAGSAA